jgi:hypothetical protein
MKMGISRPWFDAVFALGCRQNLAYMDAACPAFPTTTPDHSPGALVPRRVIGSGCCFGLAGANVGFRQAGDKCAQARSYDQRAIAGFAGIKFTAADRFIKRGAAEAGKLCGVVNRMSEGLSFRHL